MPSDFTLIAGPCSLENFETCAAVAHELLRAKDEHSIDVVFKSSYDKANRTSIKSYRGPGLDAGLELLDRVKREFQVPVTTDVHESNQVNAVARIVDVIQIPAFLCRQTDLLVAAAKAGKPVNVKKGQFLSPWDTSHIVEKLHSSGCTDIYLTERGSSFGYQNLVVDFRSLPVMKATGAKVIYDAGHSVQLPGAGQGQSGGLSEFIRPLARAAVAVGVDGIFIETHPDPSKARSDGPNSLRASDLVSFVGELIKIHRFTKGS